MVRSSNRRAGLIRTWTWSMIAAALLLPLLTWWTLPNMNATAWANAQRELHALMPSLQAEVSAVREELLAGNAASKPIFQSELDDAGRFLSLPKDTVAEALEAQIGTTPASGFYYQGIQHLADPAKALESFEQASQLAEPEETALKLQVDLAKAQILQRLDRSVEAIVLLQLWWGMAADAWTLRGKPVGLIVGHRLADALADVGSTSEANAVREELRRRLLFGSWPLHESEILIELQFLQAALLENESQSSLSSVASVSKLEREARLGLQRRALLRQLPEIAPEVGAFVGGDGVLLVDRLSRRAALYVRAEPGTLLLERLQGLIAAQPLFALTNRVNGEVNLELPNAALETSTLLLPGWQLLLTDLDAYAKPLRRKQTLLFVGVGAFALALLGMAWFGRRMLQREEALQRTRTEFLAGVSHELRTPAASLSLLSDNLLHGRVKGKERIEEYYRSMRRDARRLERLVADVLDVSRMDRGSFTIERELCDLRPVLEALVEEQAPRLKDGGIELESHFDPELPTLRVDAFAVERACANLLENIRRYAGDGAWAELLVTGTPKGGVVICVSDRGPGIPDAWRERIFESFQRLPQDEQMAAGAGLGLALVRAVLQAHGGSVRVVSGAGGIGSCFMMEFPADG